VVVWLVADLDRLPLLVLLDLALDWLVLDFDCLEPRSRRSLFSPRARRALACSAPSARRSTGSHSGPRLSVSLAVARAVAAKRRAVVNFIVLGLKCTMKRRSGRWCFHWLAHSNRLEMMEGQFGALYLNLIERLSVFRRALMRVRRHVRMFAARARVWRRVRAGGTVPVST
jgi:hypothetical protein